MASEFSPAVNRALEFTGIGLIVCLVFSIWSCSGGGGDPGQPGGWGFLVGMIFWPFILGFFFVTGLLVELGVRSFRRRNPSSSDSQD